MTGCIVRFSLFSLVTLPVSLQLFSSLVPGCQDSICLKHFGKREILKKINLMEPEFNQPMIDESRVPDQPAAAAAEIGSLGYGVQVYGVARGHRRKKETPSLLADMCGFNNSALGRDAPYFPNCYFQRHVVNYIIYHRHLIYHNKYEALMSLYGVEDTDPSRHWNLPLSFKQYLRCLLKKSFWGDKIVLYVSHVGG